jgi:hypothetical protein
MKKINLSILLTFVALAVSAQVFDQVLPLDQITRNDAAYIVTRNADTLTGRLTSYSGGNRTLNQAVIQDSELEIFRVTLRLDNGDKVDVEVDDIQLLAIQPTLGMAQFEQDNLAGSLLELRRVLKDPYMKELLGDIKAEDFEEGDPWIYYETIKATYLNTRLFKSEWDWELRQLLNPGFDSRIKVYPEIDKDIAENEDSTEIMGLKVESNLDNAYIISVEGQPLQRIQQLSYRRNAKNEIYQGCEIIEEKPKWKNLGLDIFKDHMECGSGE